MMEEALRYSICNERPIALGVNGVLRITKFKVARQDR